MWIRAPLLLAALIFLAAPGPVHAQVQTPESLIEAGVAARREGNDTSALALFTQAWSQGHAPRARAQMGLAEQALGRFVEARAHLLEALAATGDEWIAGHRGALEEAVSTVQARLAQLDVRASQPGAHLRINGREAGALPLSGPLWLMPGTVSLELRAPGYMSSTRSVNVVAGQLSRETFELPRVAPVEPVVTPAVERGEPDRVGAEGTPGPSGPVDDAPASTGSALPTIGWITGGVGIVGIGLGVVFYVQREAAARAWNDDAVCLAAGATREANCASHLADVHSAETLETISFIAGGALLVGGLALALFGGGSDDDEAPPTRASARCAPMIGSVLGAGCEGRF